MTLTGTAWRIAPRGALLLLAGALTLSVAGCKREQRVTEVFAEPIGPTTACAVDGMLLANHPGPKGQIVFADGTRAFYCDVRELWEALYDPEQAHRVKRAYVQPMDGRPWSGHPDGWADARELRYVLGSRQMGHMGPTMVPFREADAAQGFIAGQGGRPVAATDLTAEAVAAYAREVRAALRGMNLSTAAEAGPHGHDDGAAAHPRDDGAETHPHDAGAAGHAHPSQGAAQ